MAVHYGSVPFREQLRIFRDKGANLVPTATWRDLWQAAHDRAFMVAGATKADLLADIHAALLKSQEEGLPLPDFRKRFSQLAEQHGWTGWTGSDTAAGRAWRTRVIWETNLRTSYAAGRWQQIQAAKPRRPYLIYRHNDSVRYPRPLHQSWDGTILPVDHPWWQTHYTPNGWGCKCSVRSLSERDLRRRGLSVSEPPDDGIDPETGQPRGIDAGWAYAPGASLTDRVADDLRVKAHKLPPQIKADLLRDIDAALAARGR